MLNPCNLSSFARTVFAAWSPSPSPSPSLSPWQQFWPLKPDFTCSILYLNHRHHPRHHHLVIRYTKPYRNLLLYCRPSSSSKLCKSTAIVSQAGSFDNPHWVHQDGGRVLEYVHYGDSICCSTPPPGLTPFNHLQINSDWLAGRLNRFVWSSKSRLCKVAGLYRLFALDSVHYCSSSLQGRPLLNFSKSTQIDSLVGSINSTGRVHKAGARTVGYVHHWLSIRCSSSSFSSFSSSSSCSSSSSSRSEPFWKFSDQLRFTRSWAQSIRPVEYIQTLQGRWGTCIIDSQFAALLLLLLFLLLQSWPHSNFAKFTLIDSLVGSINSSRRVH